jgi:hypothetical protein
MAFITKFKFSSSPLPQKSTKRMSVVRCSGKIDFNALIDKRRQLDKERIERIKEIGSTLDHIAKSEVKHTGEVLNEFLPFLKDVKDWDKSDIENFIKDWDKKLQNKFCKSEEKTAVVADDEDDEDDA